eukprot:scaffold222247_cov24-Prasinocladus_malaysianus.AAC.1
MAKLLLLASHLSVWTCPPSKGLFPRTSLQKASDKQKLDGQLFRLFSLVDKGTFRRHRMYLTSGLEVRLMLPSVLDFGVADLYA